MSKQEIRDALRRAGLRATAPRTAVLTLLRESARPLSHGEVLSVLGEEDWDKATLFRNLVSLQKKNLLRVASRVGGVTRYEATVPGAEPHVHPHFACRDCGQVSCIHDVALTLPVDSAWRDALRGADLQLVGRCPGCRKAEAEK